MTGFTNALIGASAVYLVADGTGVPETRKELFPLESRNINPIAMTVLNISFVCIQLSYYASLDNGFNRFIASKNMGLEYHHAPV